jgi:outer membrane protein assembly factor BamE
MSGLQHRVGLMRNWLILPLVMAWAGCKQVPDVPTIISPYKIDIQQGNVVTQEMVAKLKVGMTRAQVRFALGSPLVVDPFRTDRWDYVYSFQKQGKQVERRRITVIFDEDKLVRIAGDVVPMDGTLTPETPANKSSTTPAPAPADQSATPKPAPANPEQNAPADRKPATASDKPAESSDAATTDAAKPGVEPAEGAAAGPVAPEPANSGATAAAAEVKKTDAAKSDSGNEKPNEKGFFGRMRDKLGL